MFVIPKSLKVRRWLSELLYGLQRISSTVLVSEGFEIRTTNHYRMPTVVYYTSHVP